MPSSKPRISVILSQELKDKFEKLCKNEERSMSNKTVILIKEFVEKAEKEGKI